MADSKTHRGMNETQALRRWVKQLLASLCGSAPVRRYRVTPRCRAAVFRRQLLADVLHYLKQNPVD